MVRVTIKRGIGPRERTSAEYAVVPELADLELQAEGLLREGCGAFTLVLDGEPITNAGAPKRIGELMNAGVRHVVLWLVPLSQVGSLLGRSELSLGSPPGSSTCSTDIGPSGSNGTGSEDRHDVDPDEDIDELLGHQLTCEAASEKSKSIYDDDSDFEGTCGLDEDALEDLCWQSAEPGAAVQHSMSEARSDGRDSGSVQSSRAAAWSSTTAWQQGSQREDTGSDVWPSHDTRPTRETDALWRDWESDALNWSSEWHAASARLGRRVAGKRWRQQHTTEDARRSWSVPRTWTASSQVPAALGSDSDGSQSWHSSAPVTWSPPYEARRTQWQYFSNICHEGSRRNSRESSRARSLSVLRGRTANTSTVDPECASIHGRSERVLDAKAWDRPRTQVTPATSSRSPARSARAVSPWQGVQLAWLSVEDRQFMQLTNRLAVDASCPAFGHTGPLLGRQPLKRGFVAFAKAAHTAMPELGALRLVCGGTAVDPGCEFWKSGRRRYVAALQRYLDLLSSSSLDEATRNELLADLGFYVFPDFVTNEEEWELQSYWRPGGPLYAWGAYEAGTNRRFFHYGPILKIKTEATSKSTLGIIPGKFGPMPPIVARFRLLDRIRTCALKLGDAICDCSLDFDQLYVNHYAAKLCSRIDFHHDNPKTMGGIIAGLSLGSSCEMHLKAPDKELCERPILAHLPARSLCLMTGLSRYHLQHGIPALPTDRLSLTFRVVNSECADSAAWGRSWECIPPHEASNAHWPLLRPADEVDPRRR